MKKFIKIIGALALLFVLALVGLYFYVNSGSFIQSQVLPRVSEKIGKDITAETVKFSLTSHIEMTGVSLKDEQGEILKVGTLKARYQLLPLLSSKLYVDEVLLKDVDINITQDLSKTAVSSQEEKKKKTPSKPSSSDDAPLRDIALRNIKFDNINLHYTQKSDKHEDITAEINQLKLDLPELAMNKPFDFHLSSQFSYHAKDQDIDASTKDMSLKVTGKINEQLKPNDLNLEFVLAKLEGMAGAGIKLDKREIRLSGEFSDKNGTFDIKNFKLTEIFDGKEKATVDINGSINPETKAADLVVNINNVGSSLLNLGLAPLANVPQWQEYQKQLKHASQSKLSGVGNLTINMNSTLKTEGDLLNSTVKLRIHKIPAVDNTGTIKELDFKFDHQLSYNTANSQLNVKNLEANLAKGTSQLLQIQAQGKSDQATGANIISLKKAQIFTELGNYIPTSLLGDLEVDNLNLNIPLCEIRQNDQGLELKLKLNIKELQLACRASRFRSFSSSNQLLAELNFTKDKILLIKKLQLGVDTSLHPAFNIHLSGQVDSQFKSLESSKLLVEIKEEINVDSLMKILPAKKDGQDEEVVKSDDTKDANKKTGQEPAPEKASTALKISTVIKLKKVIYQGLKLEEVNLDTAIDGKRYILKDSSFKIAGAPLNFSAEFNDTNVPDYKFALNTATIPLSPFISSFASKYLNQLSGGMAIKELAISGKGFDDVLGNLAGQGRIDISELRAKNFVTGGKSKNLLTGALGALGSIGSSTLTGIDFNNISFGQSSASFNIKDHVVNIPESSLNNKNYKMKFAGNYNLKDKTMKMKLDTGLSGALNLDKRFFSPGKDGFRYFSKEIDTSQYQGKSLLTALGLEFASYFTSFSSSMVKDNPVSNILGGLLGGNKKKNTTPKQGEKTKTPEKKDIKKDLEEKLKKKLFDKLF